MDFAHPHERYIGYLSPAYLDTRPFAIERARTGLPLYVCNRPILLKNSNAGRKVAGGFRLQRGGASPLASGTMLNVSAQPRGSAATSPWLGFQIVVWYQKPSFGQTFVVPVGPIADLLDMDYEG